MRLSYANPVAALLAFAAALLLSGCASAIRSEVSAINKLPADLKDKSFFISPYKEQEGSLEFEHYAGLIGHELQAKGLRAATAGQADLLVFFRYAFDQRTELVPAPLWGPTSYIGGGGSTVVVNGKAVFVPTYSMPAFGVGGMGVTTAVFNRRNFSLDVLDKSSTPEHPVKLYEAMVFSEGYSGTLLQVMPSMIKALFMQWPGPATRSETVDIQLPRKSRQ